MTNKSIPAVLLLILGLFPHSSPADLRCGKFNFPNCTGADRQFDNTFKPMVPKPSWGGFGGGAACRAQKTPGVFVHGNADRATSWDSASRDARPAADAVLDVSGYDRPALSVYRYFKARGYKDCELFGITYLKPSERAPNVAINNYHHPDKYRVIGEFVKAVKAYTGQPRVDIVAHSLGVTMTLATLDYYDDKGEPLWPSVRRFVNIAGGVQGLSGCIYVRNPTCQAEDPTHWIFGFYSNPRDEQRNSWTASSGQRSLRNAPLRHPETTFYTIHAGRHDEIHCLAPSFSVDCAQTARFDESPNVRAQLNVGCENPGAPKEWCLATKQRIGDCLGGYFGLLNDFTGIGHYKARNNTGEIIHGMLTTECRGIACKGEYAGGPVGEGARPAPVAGDRRCRQ